MKNNQTIRAEAREVITGNWGPAIGTIAVYLIISVVIQNIPYVGMIASLFISGHLVLGLAIFFLNYSRKEEANVNQLFDGFKNYGRTLGTYLLFSLYVLLWTLLFIIPGIIAQIGYSQVWFILAEDDQIEPNDALKKSKEMMYGYKMQYFLLGLSFIGWLLLAILTCGIGLLWVIPYMQTSNAKFYEDLKANYNSGSENNEPTDLDKRPELITE
jgi:uncharacterized membrane protein